MVFEGTTVLAGSGYAVVVATGDVDRGRAGRSGRRRGPLRRPACRPGSPRSPDMALPATAFGGAGVAGLGLLRGLPLREAIAAGVSVAVAAVPEGLPLVATVAQAGPRDACPGRGCWCAPPRTLEALGRVDTVCFDKTGTLTTGRLAVDSGGQPRATSWPSTSRPPSASSPSPAAPARPSSRRRSGTSRTRRTAPCSRRRNAAVEDDWQLRRESYFEAIAATPPLWAERRHRRARGQGRAGGRSSAVRERHRRRGRGAAAPGPGRAHQHRGDRRPSWPTRGCGCSRSPNDAPGFPTGATTSSRWSTSSP